MSNYLEKIIYLSEAQYQAEVTNNRINNNYLYVTDYDGVSINDLDQVVIDVPHGGTGLNTIPSDKLLVGNGANAITTITKTSDATGGTVVVRDASGNFSANSITANLNGTATNADQLSYASQLTTQDAIDGFLTASKFKVATFKTTSANNVGMQSNDGIIISLPWSSTQYGAQIAVDDNAAGVLKFRGKASSWGSWKTIAHDGNVTTGDANGQIKIAGTNVSVKGLQALAYKASLASADIPNNAANTTGSAGSAAAFTSAASVTLTGDVTGTASSTKGWSIATTIKESVALSGTPTAPTAANGTNTTQIATTAFVQNTLSYADAMVFKGVLAGTSSTTYTPAANCGDTYKVSAAGLINGEAVEIGDMLICTTDSTSAATSSNVSSVKANWVIVQNNIDGAVTSSSTDSDDNAVARYDGQTGRIIQKSSVTINDTGTMNIKGKLIVNPAYDTSNSYNEGIRINQASNGWANIHFGGPSNSTSANADGAWLVGRRGAAGGTAGAIGDFTIEEQGSAGQGLTIHKDSGGMTLYTSLAGGNSGILIKNNGTIAASAWFAGLNVLSANMADGSNISLGFGKANSAKNKGYIGYHHTTNGSNSNYVTIGLYSTDNLLNIFADGKVGIGTTSPTEKLHVNGNILTTVLKIEQGSASNPTTSSNARIQFTYNNGEQPVNISYTPNDSYRTPAGLKIIGGTSATPAWFEVEGNLYANGDKRVPHTGNNTGSVGGTTTPVYVDGGEIKAGTALGTAAYSATGDFATAGHNHDEVYLKSHSPSYGKITVGVASSSTANVNGLSTATSTTAVGANEAIKVNPANKWIKIEATNSTASGSDTITFGHIAPLTAKTSYCSTSATASANGGKIKVTDIQYDEAGHITSSQDREITLSQTTYSLSSLHAASDTHTHGNITNDGKVGTGNALLKTASGTVTAGPTIGTDATKFLNNKGEWAVPAYIDNVAYGNISVTGTISTSATIATNDTIVISTTANSGKVTKAKIVFNTANTSKVLSQAGTWVDLPTNSDTKNTAGASATATKIFLVGATSQSTSAQTYSNTAVYATDGVLSAKSFGVNYGTTANKVTLQWNDTDQSLDFVFA